MAVKVHAAQFAFKDTVNMRLFVDNLINVDFSYLHPERGLVGETWLAHVELIGELDEQGMICDFGIVKRTLREWLDTELDHRLLVPTASSNLDLERDQQQLVAHWRFNDKELICRSPETAFALVSTDTITPDNVAKWCISQLQSIFPQTIQQIALYFSTEQSETPVYQYSHGLKKHRGNCQRIAHGHRSTIKVWRNGELCERAMGSWATRFTDVYIGTSADLAEERDGSYRFAYSAQQGDFELILPREHCYLIDTDSTVELIAQHIADELVREEPTDEFIVKAFEGIGKGAIAEGSATCKAP